MSNDKKKYSAKKARRESLMIAFAFLVFTIISFFGTVQYQKQQDAIDGGVIVKAEIVGVASLGGGDGHKKLWSLVYRYVDGNGTVYSGYCNVDDFKEEYIARSRIGTKVDIYIDGNGHSIPVGEKPGTNTILVFGIIFLIVFLICISVYIWQLANRKKLEAKEFEEEKVDIEKPMCNSEDIEDLQCDELTTTEIENEDK